MQLSGGTCRQLLPPAGGWGFQQGMPTGPSRLEQKFQSATCQQQYQQDRLRLQKCLLPASQSLWRVPAGFYLSSSCFKVSKWVSLPMVMRFLIWSFVMISRSRQTACKSLKSRFSVLYSFIIFLYTIPIGFRSQVFWGSSFLCNKCDSRMPDVEFKCLTLQGMFRTF